MNKLNLFEQIVQICSEVCSVEASSVMGTNRSESVVMARSIVVFYCTAFGMPVTDILSLTGRTHPNSVNSIKAKMERLWCERYSYHIWIREVGERLTKVLADNGEEFDYNPHIYHIQKVTNKFYYRQPSCK